MESKNAYLIIDIGTGNVRVGVVDEEGKVVALERDNVHYIKDPLYPESLYFNPDALWAQIVVLAKKVLVQSPGVHIRAVTASSQREGIVLVDNNGKSLLGLPNHDHRGREWENIVSDAGYVYRLTGRYPTSLFSAMKLVGVRERHSAIYNSISTILSISDWAQFQLCGKAGYEHSQASETLLFDVEHMKWSDELCAVFNIDPSILPPLQHAGTILGTIMPEYVDALQLPNDTVVVVGGADTQLAIKSTQPSIEDIVIVSGTTTPIVKIVDEYIIDEKQRTWTNRHTDRDRFILEANAGVTGLNYQRLKEIFYPNESYDVIEKELNENTGSQCVASLGSLIAEEKFPLTKGGFIFSTPVSHELKRSSFVRATLWDIACCIKENFESLCDVATYNKDFVWACGGGIQSTLLLQFIANLTGKKVKMREGFENASVVGAALICNEALGHHVKPDTATRIIFPGMSDGYTALYTKWKETRSRFREEMEGEVSL